MAASEGTMLGLLELVPPKRTPRSDNLIVSRSGFHDHLARQANPSPDRDATVRRDLKRCHTESRGTYGRPRLLADLRERGHVVGPKRVARLMREEGVCGKAKGRAKPRTTDSGHVSPVAENLLARQFDVTSPTPAWVYGW